MLQMGFARLVYSLRYCYERGIKPSKKTLEKMAREGRYVLLIDDRGTIFPKNWLEEYFEILLYECLIIGNGWFNTVTLLRTK